MGEENGQDSCKVMASHHLHTHTAGTLTLRGTICNIAPISVSISSFIYAYSNSLVQTILDLSVSLYSLTPTADISEELLIYYRSQTLKQQFKKTKRLTVVPSAPRSNSFPWS